MLKHVLLLSLLPGFAFAQELPDAVKAIEKQGITIIKPFDAPGGMKGYLGKYQDMGVTIYVTPDGKHAISGYMYDEKGSNLSEKIIQKEIYAPAGRELWQRMEKASWILDGKKDAPQIIYVFADPFCPYCKAFWSEAQPWVKAGKVQLNTLLVAFLNPNSGRNASAILNAEDPVSAWRDYELSGGKTLPKTQGDTSHATFNILQQHQKLMDSLGANATPAIYYLNAKNELQQVVGMPDEKQLLEMFGPKPQ